MTVGGFTGVGTDWFALHPLNGMKFTTLDNDNDDSNRNCAAISKNGWWFNHCRLIDTNRQPPFVHGDVLFTEMKIRPKECFVL